MDNLLTDVRDSHTNPVAVEELILRMQSGEPPVEPPVSESPEMPDDNEPLLFPAWIYDSLPHPLRTLCAFFDEGFERDVFLSAALAVISGILSNVNYKHRDGWNGVNLFMLVIAPASNGKGIAGQALRLGEKIDERIREQSEREIEVWHELKKQAEAAEKWNANRKDKDKKEVPEVGPKPRLRTFFISANASQRAIIDRLLGNDGEGLIQDTELKSFLNANKQEWGEAHDIYLKTFHNEPISLDRTNDVSIRISKPRFAAFLSGTPDSLKRMFRAGAEDGLFSRFFIYVFRAFPVWRSQRPQPNFEEREAVFNTAATFFDELHLRLSQRENPLPCWFKEEQWNQIDNRYESATDSLNASSSDSLLHASLRRNAVVAQRMACLFAVLRNAEQAGSLKSINPSDEEIKIGMELARVYSAHAVQVAATLDVPEKIALTGKQLGLLTALPACGSNHDYFAVAKSQGINERTARRWKDGNTKNGIFHEGIFMKLDLLERQPNGSFRKTNKGKPDTPDNRTPDTPEFE